MYNETLKEELASQMGGAINEKFILMTKKLLLYENMRKNSYDANLNKLL